MSRLPAASQPDQFRATLGGVSSQPYGPPVYFQEAPMGMGIFGDDAPSILEPTIKDVATMPVSAPGTVDDKLDEVIRRLKAEERDRKISQMIAVGGALFAAARLGIIWLPFIKKKIWRSE